MDTYDRRTFLRIGTTVAAAAMTGRAFAADASPGGPPAFRLAPLPYAPAALEPHIDAVTMALHHDKHHAAYISKLNEALAAKPMPGKSLDELVAGAGGISDAALQSAVRNQGGGHWNHTFFWNIMTPAKSSGAPSDDLLAAIHAEFGSLDKCKAAFSEAAVKRFGSGWAWLIAKDGKLKITSTANQDNPLMKGIVPDADLGTPILGVDVWEHAYYLKYQNRRPEYVAAWWNVVNWPAVNERFGKAKA
jgi:Fe-Mn family superoxide dismutase